MSSGSVGIAILTGGAGQAAGALVVPAAEAGKGIYTSLKRKYDYIKNLGQNFEKLEREAEYLSSREKDVKDKIDRNLVMMEMTHECNTWLNEVRQMSEDLKELKTRYQKANNGSCGPCQWNTRLKLSRKIVKVTKSVVDLKDRMNPEHVFLRERPVERVEKKFPKKIDVPTLNENVERLLEFLTDDSIKKVGIWGMPGVGKTTILESLNDEVGKLQIFDIVLLITVSKEGNPHQIQQKILKRLDVKVEEFDADNHGAALISKSLEKRKYLLLLDEVASEIKLRDIGIFDNHMHGKVVVATRERSICNSMDMDEEIRVERLSRKEARKLFRDVVGDTFEHPVIKPIAEKVLMQCGELPLLIRAVGIHLKGRLNEDIWRDTLSKLQSPCKYPLKHLEEVFTAFKLIYEELQGSLKNCLLYGASFPEDYEIYRDHLVECWKAEQLIGLGHTLRKAREEGNSNLESLIERCLFDPCKSTKYVKMPIIFRNAARRMADHQNFGILIRDGEEFESYPPVEKWRDVKVISLMDSGLQELPENPECPSVSAIFLQKNRNLSVIPTLFFGSMPVLKILDLYGTGINILPSSISELTNLRGLYLNGCNQLMQLPEEIEKLIYLEVLDIRSTGIQGFPEVIRNLTRIQCLRVSFCIDLRNQNQVDCNGVEDISPSRIFNQLLQLEELTIEANPLDPSWNKIAPEIAVQLARLEKLNALSFYFPTIESLQDFTQASISWKNGTSRIERNFRSFNISVGSHESHNLPPFEVSNCSGRRYLQYSNGKDTPPVIKEVLRVAYAFRLIGHQDIKCFSDFGIDNMEILEVCEVKECNAMTAVVGDNVTGTRAFQWLKELHLLKLQQFNHICKGSITSNSFARLTTLTVCECPNLKKVVSWEMAKQLTELQHLRIEKCSQVTEVIEAATQSGESGAFPKLKILELVSLQELVMIYASDLFEWHALRQVEIIECEKLANLCWNKMNATKLHRIKCSQAWWGSLILNHEIRAHFQASCRFVEQN